MPPGYDSDTSGETCRFAGDCDGEASLLRNAASAPSTRCDRRLLATSTIIACACLVGITMVLNSKQKGRSHHGTEAHTLRFHHLVAFSNVHGSNAPDNGQQHESDVVDMILSDSTTRPEMLATTTNSPQSLVCNMTAPVPRLGSIQKWKLSPSWRRVCELKNRQEGRYPFERNWCWIGLKDACHANLKKHKSWREYQDMAADDGKAPSYKEAPFHPLQNPHICDNAESGATRPWTNTEWKTAYAWANEHLNVYVLNLRSDTKRYETISERLDVLNIKFTHVLGVDMRVPGSRWVARRAGWIPPDFDFDSTQERANTKKHNMGSILGTLGCASAHFKVATKAVIDGKPLAVVMEDDSWPEDDFIPRLWSLVTQELPCDWEATALMSRCPYGTCISPRLARVQPDVNEPAWRCHQGVNWGMHAVLYRVETLPSLLDKWKAVVFDEKRPRCMDVDVALASISDEVGFYAVPAVQKPGFLREGDLGSSRWTINVAAER